ncbi:beta strand repeat-containing protein, partial [Flavobacterium sp.]|uniref:beta strand repeat-containing protein n=1 Tax=Flavobacterium sp. TaxID=239 RepID=UPI0037BF6877
NLTGADLYIEDLNVASQDADENDIPSTLTINGTGNLIIDGLNDDDNVDIVYTGSGSIDIGSEGQWEPGNGSFNASTATGAVTIELDLTEESDIDFTYVGSKGNDRVTIEEDTLGTAAADDNTVALSLAGGTGVDTFVVSDDSDLTAEALALVSGFEVLELANSVEDEGDNAYIDSVFAEEFDTEGLATGRVYDLEDADEFSSVVVDTQGSDENLALINLTAQQATNLTFKYDAGDQLNGLIVDLENQTGVSDVVSMTIVTDESSGDYSDLEGDFAEGYMFINDVETINFNITGDAFYKDGNGDYITDGDSIFVGIDGLVADEVEKINITGTVNFGIGSIGYTEYDFVDGNEPNSDLREIDATGFTGEQLVLGGFMGPIGIFTEDDLIINGSRVSNHFIAAMSTEDITVTTGSGNDAMYLMAQNDIIVNSGSGNDDINVNANGDVIVNTAEGDDNVFVDAAIDATITMGAGNDEFDYNYNDIDGDLTVDAGAGDDDININLDSDGNLDSATVTLGSGADDLYLGSTRFDADNDFVVTVTDFAAAADVLYFDEDAEGVEWSGDGDAYEADYVTVGTQDGDYDVTDGVSSDDIGLIEFTFDADNNGVELDIASTGADLLEALGDDGDSAIITVNNDQDGYIVAYNGGNAYIFNYETDIDGLPTATLTNGTSNTAVITFTEGTGDGWEAGDVITISGLVMAATDGADEGGTAGDDFDEWAASGSFTYTVEADDTITDIANAIANGITNYTDSDYTASFAGGVVTIYDGSNSVYDPENFVTVSFTEATETDTVIQEDQIELIGVLENVAVGSLSTANFGFYDWTVA